MMFIRFIYEYGDVVLQIGGAGIMDSAGMVLLIQTHVFLIFFFCCMFSGHEQKVVVVH